jgi:hypothetical protein
MNTKKPFIFAVACMFTAATFAQSANTDLGVVINGVKWATRNVDAPGTFAESPQAAGMFYQWNRNKSIKRIENAVETLQATSVVTIADLQGRTVMVQTWRAASLQNGAITINISHLPQGVYLVCVGNNIAKLVKE